jgi:hypothetical protein
VVWIDSARIAGAESPFSISVEDSRTTFNELVLGFKRVNPRKNPWVSSGCTGSETVVSCGISTGASGGASTEAPFSVSLFFESPSCRKVGKIKNVAINEKLFSKLSQVYCVASKFGLTIRQ